MYLLYISRIIWHIKVGEEGDFEQINIRTVPTVTPLLSKPPELLIRVIH